MGRRQGGEKDEPPAIQASGHTGDYTEGSEYASGLGGEAGPEQGEPAQGGERLRDYRQKLEV